jgi:hypothetical protein
MKSDSRREQQVSPPRRQSFTLSVRTATAGVPDRRKRATVGNPSRPQGRSPSRERNPLLLGPVRDHLANALCTQPRSVDRSVESRRQPVKRLPPVLPGPGQVAIRPRQHRGHIRFPTRADHDPIRPAGNRKPTGPAERQPAPATPGPTTADANSIPRRPAGVRGTASPRATALLAHPVEPGPSRRPARHKPGKTTQCSCYITFCAHSESRSPHRTRWRPGSGNDRHRPSPERHVMGETSTASRPFAVPRRRRIPR